MKDANGWVLLLWEGKRLFGVFGPFATQDKARAAAVKEPEMRAEVVPLWKASQVGK